MLSIFILVPYLFSKTLDVGYSSCHSPHIMKQFETNNVVTEPEKGKPHMNRPQPLSTDQCSLSLSLRVPYFSVLVMLLFVLFGSVYTGGVGAIVCW